MANDSFTGKTEMKLAWQEEPRSAGIDARQRFQGQVTSRQRRRPERLPCTGTGGDFPSAAHMGLIEVGKPCAGHTSTLSTLTKVLARIALTPDFAPIPHVLPHKKIPQLHFPRIYGSVTGNALSHIRERRLTSHGEWRHWFRTGVPHT
jgi:hypothetical protein